MSLTLVDAPEKEPLSTANLRDQLKISDTVEDGLLERLRFAARQRGERSTRRAFITSTWDLFLAGPPSDDDVIRLPKAPLQEVVFVKYTDISGTVNTWDPSNYIVEAPDGDYASRGTLSLDWAKVWPIVRPVKKAIQIRFTAGYGDDPESVPELLRQAMLLDVGTMYDVRARILSGTRAAAIEIPSTTRDIYLSFRSL